METTALNQKKLGFDNHFALDTNGFDFSMVNFVVSHLQPKIQIFDFATETSPVQESIFRNIFIRFTVG